MKFISSFFNYLRPGVLALALMLANVATASALTKVDDVRIGVSNERTRLVLDLSSRVNFEVFLLENPRRVVVDLPSLQWPGSLQPKSQGFIGDMRFGQFTADKSRLVLDLKQPATVSKSFILGKTSGLPVRLVIDMVPSTAAQFTEQVNADRLRNQQKTASAPAPAAKPVLQTPKPKKRKSQASDCH
jgi:N-acetylmuramoyl-L-alanine amidase